MTLTGVYDMASMTLGEFRALTASMDDSVELRIAYQPNYPLECTLSHIKVHGDGLEEAEQIRRDLRLASVGKGDLAGASSEDLHEAAAALAEADEKPTYLYLMEGSQIGYASRTLWDEGE